MKKFIAVLAIVGLVLRALCAEADYRQVLIFTNGDSVRVRLPLTDVTGKVRVKERVPGGFGVPVAPRKTALNGEDYLEWQIQKRWRNQIRPRTFQNHL